MQGFGGRTRGSGPGPRRCQRWLAEEAERCGMALHFCIFASFAVPWNPLSAPSLASDCSVTPDCCASTHNDRTSYIMFDLGNQLRNCAGNFHLRHHCCNLVSRGRPLAMGNLSSSPPRERNTRYMTRRRGSQIRQLAMYNIYTCP